MKAIANQINQSIIKQWIAKGHKLSDKGFIASLRSEETVTPNGFEVVGFGAYDSKFRERGVSASNVPYSGRTGNGGTSKYIEGLARYVALRMGINDKRKALGVAFAIATKHRTTGIRIRERGQGSKFLTDAFKDPEIDRVIRREMDIFVGKKIDGVMNKYFK